MNNRRTTAMVQSLQEHLEQIPYLKGTTKSGLRCVLTIWFPLALSTKKFLHSVRFS